MSGMSLGPLSNYTRNLSKDELWWKQGFEYLGFRHFTVDYGLRASGVLENDPDFFLGVNPNYKIIVMSRIAEYHDIFAYYSRAFSDGINENTSVTLVYKPIDRTQYKLSLGTKMFSNYLFATSNDIDHTFLQIVRSTMDEWKAKLGKLQECLLIPWPEREEIIRQRFLLTCLEPKEVKKIKNTRMIRVEER